MPSRIRIHILALATVIAAGLVAPAAASGRTPRPACTLSSKDRRWMEETVSAWRKTRRDELRLPDAPLPWLVFFDSTCTWHVTTHRAALDALVPASAVARTTLWLGGARATVAGVAHGDSIRLPDGRRIAPGLVTFAATYGRARRPFLVFAMPSVWRADPRHAADANLGRLVRSVFVHEMTHTAQTRAYGERLDAIAAAYGLGDSMDDDMVQERFESAPGYRAAFERERDLLYRAAAEPDAARRRALAGEALDAIRSRRARYFVGRDTMYAEIELLFLSMEGTANWAGYRAAADGGMSAPAALDLMRGSRRHHSQEEGLALFLVIDSLVPCWKERVFAATTPTVLDLLAEAAGRAPFPATGGCGASVHPAAHPARRASPPRA